MRETRTSGSEGGGAHALPTPINGIRWTPQFDASAFVIAPRSSGASGVTSLG